MGNVICTNCGEDFPELDEATELCDACFEHIFGYFPEDDPAFIAEKGEI